MRISRMKAGACSLVALVLIATGVFAQGAAKDDGAGEHAAAGAVGRYQIATVSVGNDGHVYLLDTTTAKVWYRENANASAPWRYLGKP